MSDPVAVTIYENDVPRCSRCGPLPDLPETSEAIREHVRSHWEADHGPTTLGP